MRNWQIIVMVIFVDITIIPTLAQNSELINAVRHGAQARITIRVVEPNGVPVENVEVSTGFFRPGPPKPRQIGFTDSNGFYHIQDITRGDMNYQINKKGFYPSNGQYQWVHNVQDGRWLPWDPTVEVILKPKINPVPMYAKEVELEILPGDSRGYDFVKGDWVMPNGKGLVADVSISCSETVRDNIRYWTRALFIRFINEMDGVITEKCDDISEFKASYHAPLNKEYVKGITYVIERSPQGNKRETLEGDQYLILRLRTETDEDGNVVSANYGKIYGPIQFEGRIGEMEKKRIRFTYYYNPDGTTNLEFDPEKNLLKLGRTEIKPNLP